MNSNDPGKPDWAAKLKEGSVVQLSPEKTKNRMFSACMLTVTDVYAWGVQGYVQGLGQDEKIGMQAYYRAAWDTFEFVGEAAWVIA